MPVLGCGPSQSRAQLGKWGEEIELRQYIAWPVDLDEVVQIHIGYKSASEALTHLRGPIKPVRFLLLVRKEATVMSRQLCPARNRSRGGLRTVLDVWRL